MITYTVIPAITFPTINPTKPNRIYFLFTVVVAVFPRTKLVSFAFCRDECVLFNDCFRLPFKLSFLFVSPLEFKMSYV